MNRIYIGVCLCLLLIHAGCATTSGPFFKAAEKPTPEPATPETTVTTPEKPQAGSDEYCPPVPSGPERISVGSAAPLDTPEPQKSSQQYIDEALNLVELSQQLWQKGLLENAIDALDQAYALVLEADEGTGGEAPELIQQKDDLRYMISRRILEIYASRNTVVTGNHHAIPLVKNDYVEKEIKLFTGREKEFFLSSYRRSGQYRPMIVNSLKAAGLPEELSWLPLIESGFKVRALSRARALGPWQFIASTGYKFGLKRDRYVDERMDPVKSTNAAIEYLKELHQIFGDWTTVLAAYNCGEGRVLRTIRSQNVNYLDNFWDLYERLPRETARYVPRFIAAVLIIKNPEEYGMTLPEPDPPLRYDVVNVDRSLALKDVAEVVGSCEADLAELNPELRHQVTPPDTTYPLRVPPGKEQVLVASLSSVPTHRMPEVSYVYHRIRRGETLSTIARRYRTSTSAIARANNIGRRNLIVAGRTLKIPVGSGAGRVAPASRTPGKPTNHIVRRGDSLWNLARRYGVTIGDIQRANNMKSTDLFIGQRLTIPGGEVAKASASAKAYVVRSGDSPYSIARKHNMSLNRFLAINNLTRSSRIYPGQKVLVE